MDRSVWAEFLDPVSGGPDTVRLAAEYNRLWASVATSDVLADATLETEVRRLSQKTLEQLQEEYAARPRNRTPKRTSQEAVVYDRDPLVVALRKRLAGHRCEVEGCTGPTFENEAGQLFVEVHHLTPLAEGGEDVLENTIALCPTHHRWLHHAINRTEMRNQLIAKRQTT